MALAVVSLAACQKEKTPETVSRNITIKTQAIYAPTKAGIGMIHGHSGASVKLLHWSHCQTTPSTNQRP